MIKPMVAIGAARGLKPPVLRGFLRTGKGYVIAWAEDR